MADILSQQAAEKMEIKEAVAKRSLMEIQQEQEFLTWWDNESKRILEEEAQTAKAMEKSSRGGRSGKGRGGGVIGGGGESRGPGKSGRNVSGAGRGGRGGGAGRGGKDRNGKPPPFESVPGSPAPVPNTS